jgi:hypothetical protein
MEWRQRRERERRARMRERMGERGGRERGGGKGERWRERKNLCNITKYQFY